jgi:NADH-ubiquinone oxidoreductase chain 5
MGCSIALFGFPFIAGFYSKDLILESYIIFMEVNYFMFLIIILGTIFTASYSLRLIYFLFVKNIGQTNFRGLGEEKISLISISFLFIFAVTGGRILSWGVIPIRVVVLTRFLKILILSGIIILIIIFLISLTNESLKQGLRGFISSYFIGGI